MATNGSSKESEKSDQKKCKLCHLAFNDIYSYTDHLESKEHIKNVMKQKYAKKYLEAKQILDEKNGAKSNVSNDSEGTSNSKSDSETAPNSDKPDSKSGSSTKPESKATSNSNEIEKDDSSSDEEDDVYTCDVCDKICTGLVNYKLHLSGNKHRKKLRQNKTMEELKEKNLVPSSYRAPDMELLSQLKSHHEFASSDIVCEICNVSCTGPEVYKQHCKGDPHKKKAGKLRLEKEMKDDGLISNHQTEDPEEAFCCAVCEKAFSGIVPYKQHLESLVHKKKEKKNQKLEKVKDLCITSPENSKLQCKECHKMFSGPGPFEEHLKTSLHGKLKKKNSLYEELEKKYPEMIKTSIMGASDSEDSEDDILKPACGICNMIFSGPEAARDHFASIKHKKALKKKKHIEKKQVINKSEKSLKKSSSVEKQKQTNGNNEACSSEDDFEKISV